MAQILVRGLDKRTVTSLKRLAKGQRRSLQSQVKTILEREANPLLQPKANPPKVDYSDFLKFLDEFREKTKGRKFPDTVKLIREGRY